MRNPRKSVDRLPKSLELGIMMRDLLETGVAKHPGLRDTASYLRGKPVHSHWKNEGSFPEGSLN